MTIRRTRARVGLVGLVLAATAVTAAVLPLGTAPASALSPGLSFSADQQTTWQTDATVYALASTDGIVVAGGDFTSIRPPAGVAGAPRPVTGLAIFDAVTGAPADCQLPVAAVDTPGQDATVRALAVGPGGVVYVGGNFNRLGGVEVSRLAAIDVDTCEVLPWRPPDVNSFVRTLALRGTTLYLGGDFDAVGTEPRGRYAAVSTQTGTLLPWQVDVDRTGRALGVSPDGKKVAVGGSFDTVNGVASHAVAVVDATTGAVVRSYGRTFIPERSVIKTIWSGPTDFFLGAEGTGGGVFDGRLAIDWTTLDQTWRDTCLGATQAVLEYEGTVYSASHVHDCGDWGFPNGRRSYFLAQDADTGAHVGWDPRGNDGTNEGLGPRALTVVETPGSAPQLWVGGEFTEINDKPQQGLTRFGVEDTGAPAAPVLTAEALGGRRVQVRWLTVVDPDDEVLTYRVYRDGAAKPLWTGTSRSLWWQRPQVSFVDTTAKPGRTHVYRVTASDGTNTSRLSAPVRVRTGTATAAYARRVRTTSPLLYWPMARGGDPSRVLETGANRTQTRRSAAIVQGGAARSPASPLRGDRTGSTSFDGKDDYLWNDDVRRGPAAYTLELWFRTTSPKGGQLLNYGNGRPRTDYGAARASAPATVDRTLYLTSGGAVYFGTNTGSRTAVLNSRRGFNDGRWHYVVATSSPRGRALYVDGRRVASGAASPSTTGPGVWHVGGDSLRGFPGPRTSTMYRGLVDEVAVHTRALEPKRVTALYRLARR